MKKHQINNVTLGDFIFRHKCHDWCSTYIAALQILGETAKYGWTTEDVIDAVSRAESLKEEIKQYNEI